MDGFNYMSIAISVIALVISTVIAARQVAIAKNSTHLTLVTTAMQNVSGELLQSEEYLRGHIVEGGVPISDLDEPQRMHAFRVAYQYQMLGYLSRVGIVDREIVRGLAGVRVINSWTALADCVEAERTRYPGHPGFRFFEDLAAESAARDVTRMLSRMKLRRFTPRTRPAEDLAQ